MTSTRLTFKMVLLGEGAVGKTAIRERFLGKGFNGKYTMTLGADFALKRIELDDTMYVTQIWDLAGQSGFMKTRKLYYGGAMAGLLVFDINNPESFNKLDIWINEIRDNVGEIIPLVLIGNKSDLRGEFDDQVPSTDGIQYARNLSKMIGYRVPYIETSALEGKNIETAFTTLIKNVASIIAGEAPNYDPDNIDETLDIIDNASTDKEEIQTTVQEETDDKLDDSILPDEKEDRWNIPQIEQKTGKKELTEKTLNKNENGHREKLNQNLLTHFNQRNLFSPKYKSKQLVKNYDYKKSKYRKRK